MLLLVNKLHFRLLGFTPRRSLSSSLTLIVSSTIVMPSRFVTAASHHGGGRCEGLYGGVNVVGGVGVHQRGCFLLLS